MFTLCLRFQVLFLRHHPSCFFPGVWFLLPLLTSLMSRMTVTKIPSQTKPESQPIIPATPPQLNTIHPTPVVVGQIILISLVVLLLKKTVKINFYESCLEYTYD